MWWGGEGFPGAIGFLEGVVMVMISFHIPRQMHREFMEMRHFASL
jgi:hypothetical protein